MLRRVPVSVSLAFLSGFGGDASLHVQCTTSRIGVDEPAVQTVTCQRETDSPVAWSCPHRIDRMI